MAENEVNYASVVFKSDKQRNPANAAKEEDIVYDEVKVKAEANQQPADSPGRAQSSPRRCVWLAGCLAIVCVVLLSGLVGVAIYIATINDDKTETNQLKENQTTLLATNKNLTELSEQLKLEKDVLTKEQKSLKLQLENMTQNYNVSEGKNTELKTQIEQLTEENQKQMKEIQEQKENFTNQIKDLEDNWNEFNVSRAQWTIDTYCPKDQAPRRTCSDCQAGWEKNQMSCYVFINSEDPPEPKTWEEARENCRGRGADLVVVHNEDEKKILNDYSARYPVPNGYWIGLKVEGGTWKWINGTDLTDTSWIEPPTEGHCAVSLMNRRWASVRCDEKRTRVCTHKALSL
ncbi:asialoglycoprotein receptor 1-like isoform X2 [Pungitius pungitius]|uniref:asialoglycoprotein receptor 1-like isoform X2 n=1 Tax=Pungitius pungitius TaxID=134920 RepID=UPI002E153D99